MRWERRTGLGGCSGNRPIFICQPMYQSRYSLLNENKHSRVCLTRRDRGWHASTVAFPNLNLNQNTCLFGTVNGLGAILETALQSAAGSNSSATLSLEGHFGVVFLLKMSSVIN